MTVKRPQHKAAVWVCQSRWLHLCVAPAQSGVNSWTTGAGLFRPLAVEPSRAPHLGDCSSEHLPGCDHQQVRRQLARMPGPGS